jgi:MYXO-CTERM domain-containing protein
MPDAGRDGSRRKAGLVRVGGALAALAPLAGLLLDGCGPGEPTRTLGPESKVSAPAGSSTAATAGPQNRWLEDVSTRIAAGEYRVRVQGRGMGASNRAHRLSATWQEDGISIRSLAASAHSPGVGVRSVALGRGGAIRSLTGGQFRIGQCRADRALDEKGECLRRVERDAGGIVEWWENRPGGLEQGFTIPQPPRPGGAAGPGEWLRIEVQVVGARTEVAADSSRAVLTDRDGRRFLYAGLAAEDSAHRALPTRMRPGARGLWLEIDDAAAQYPILVDPVLTALGWTAGSNQADGGLEMTVAGAGDVNDDSLDDVLVAFPGYNGVAADEGRVFLYFGGPLGPEAAPAWSSQGTRAAGTPAATAGSRFGSSAATAGDVDGDGFFDVIIGQSHWSNPEVSEGRAYVFHGSSEGLATTPGWVVEGNVDDIFMGAVSGAGDIDGDAYDDVIVGAPATTGVGRILVFLGSATGLGTMASDTILGMAGQRFGARVASAGDVNGDGLDDVVVAASSYSSPELNEGAAFAYLGQASGKLAPGFLFLSGARDRFETDEAGAGVDSVAGVGDVNGDGYADVAVGSSRKDQGSAASDIDEGVVFLFTGSALGLVAAPVIIESNVAGSRLGATVAGPGDVNGDGFADIAIGAPGWDKGPIASAGAVILIPGGAAGPATTIASLADTILLGTLENDNLGSALGAAGDVNLDGYADVIAGAAGVDGGLSNQGRATVYLGSASTTGLRRASDLAIESNTAGAGLGLTVSSAGDVNGDGFTDLALAAPDHAGAGNGRVFLYHGGAGGPDSTVDGTLVGPAGAGFGKALARAGDVDGDGFGDLLVGAPNFSDGQSDEGRVLLFSGSPGGITAATVPVTFDSNLAGALLGSSVGASDVNGDGFHDVLAGAPGLDRGQPGEGGLYFVRGSPSGLLTDLPTIVESDAPGARFGASVAGAGDVNADGFGDVVVGAPGYSGSASGQGRIYVYRGQASGLGAVTVRDGEESDAALGTSVDSAGDADFDGLSDVAAGAPGSNGDSGTVYVWDGNRATGVVVTPYSYVSSVAGARLGASVAGGVDLDRDGHADVVAGAPGYSNGQAGEGAVFVFLSGGTVLPGAVSLIMEGGTANLRFGSSVSGAGDVNGDGVGDVVVGAPGYTGGESGEGRVFLHLGNTNGRPYRLRALRPGLSTLVQPGSVVPASLSAFDIAIQASGPLGITRVRLESEVKPLGVPFDDNDTVIEAAYTTTGLSGVTLTRHVTGLARRTAYHYRARLQYDPAQRFLRGRTTPWIYGSQAEATGVHLRTDGVAAGTACTMAGECGAGFCVDGVCCTSACGGGVTTDCLACSVDEGGTQPDGTCSNLAVGSSCNDASNCTAADSCQAGGLCQGTPTVICPPAGACRIAGCDPVIGTCSSRVQDDGTPCSDDNRCTTTDSCRAGTCVAGTAADCDDEDACTTDSCEVTTGCVNLLILGCRPGPESGLDAGLVDAPADRPLPDAPGTPADAVASADAAPPYPGPVPDASADAGRDTPSADSRVEIRRVGGGGCDCNVSRPGSGQALPAFFLIALATLLHRRRRSRQRAYLGLCEEAANEDRHGRGRLAGGGPADDRPGAAVA